jgi:3-methyladenine DNA glycosylase AlkD
MTAQDFMQALAKLGNPERVAGTMRFFKTQKGGYGEGDQFLGATVPKTRLVCKEFKDLSLPEIQKLLDSPIHDYRLGAVLLLADQYKKADADKRQAIFDLYLKNLYKGRINNWDIIDSSAEFVIGPHIEKTDRKLLFELAKGDDLWRRRASILSAFHYVKHGDAATTLALAEELLADRRDLIQKAVGWQLREVGKRVDRGLLLTFLDQPAATMPRTTLRYAVEHLPAEQRTHYMQLAQTAKE